MQESTFHDLVDEVINQLEDELDELEQDLDIEFSAGVLTVVCPNGSSVIVSRQVPSREIWVAARSGGFHLRQNSESDWFCHTTEETLPALLSRVFSEQLGEPVSLLA